MKGMLSDYQKYRLFETIPGLLVWGTLIVCVVLAFTRPLVMIYFIILFDVYWVLKVINFSFYLFWYLARNILQNQGTNKTNQQQNQFVIRRAAVPTNKQQLSYK